VNFPAAIATCFRKCVNFRGRAPRSEYWYFQLFTVLLVLGSEILAALAPEQAAPKIMAAMLLAYFLVVFIPGLAVTWRRLHDVNHSGWWYLLAFVPFGAILLLVWTCMKGTHGPNRFGDDPFGENVAETFA
jgi:uncharacterized membrane protein YhaH (DUF805 family)